MKSNNTSDKPAMIWVFTDSLAEQLDAASWLEVTRELRELGWHVDLITAGLPDQKTIKDVPVTSISKPNVYLISQVIFHWRVLRFIARRWKGTDVVYFHQMSAPWLLPLRLLRKVQRRPVPLIIMDTRTAPMIPKEAATRRDRLRTFYDSTMNRLANHLADGQTAITIRMAAMMRIPQDQLLGVWPSGVFLERFAKAQDVRQWPDAGQEIHLIYIGALHVQRNLMNFCTAVERANEAGMNFAFTMVGWGTDRENLAAFAASTDGRIQVLAPVPHEEIPDILAQAHVGVLPFPDQERFRVSSPIKLFEYLAAGMPILATRIVCHTDVVGGGRFAFWADGADPEALLGALTSLWNSRQSLPELGQEAGWEAANWTWQAAAVKLDDALKSGMSFNARNEERD